MSADGFSIDHRLVNTRLVEPLNRCGVEVKVGFWHPMNDRFGESMVLEDLHNLQADFIDLSADCGPDCRENPGWIR